ncbi:hypothetical protein ZWY2020_022336 [Hordeum vulgare]|nr:hypothetical protein ZWY2020_022336 [Hordeum vulgare]
MFPLHAWPAQRTSSSTLNEGTTTTAVPDRTASRSEAPNDTGPNGYPKQTTTSQQKQSNLGAGNGPSNSAMHQDLRFGAFEPTSAPAKIGSRAASIQPSLPRILGKTPRSNKGSEQSKSVLKPLSLEEYLVGAKAESNTLDAVHGAPAPSTGVIIVSTDIACMEGGIAAGLTSPNCQPQAATPSQHMQVHEGAALALHAHANNPARTEDAAATVMLCSDSCTPRFENPSEYDIATAAELCDGKSASTFSVELGSTLCTANQEDNCEDAVMDGPDFIPKVGMEVAPIEASPQSACARLLQGCVARGDGRGGRAVRGHVLRGGGLDLFCANVLLNL